MFKPIIGIVGRCSKNHNDGYSIEVLEFYRRALIKENGNPILILPPQDTNYYQQKVSELASLTEEEKEMLKQQLDLCDGILLPGGFKTFQYDNFIIDYCIKKDKPILGICLGMQIMANYGTKSKIGLPNFITEKNIENELTHFNNEKKYIHKVTISKNSKLYNILNTETFAVNSLHSYHVADSPIYSIVGYSEDKVIEAVEYPENRFNIGVQWHPERLIDDNVQHKLLSSFIKSCKE